MLCLSPLLQVRSLCAPVPPGRLVVQDGDKGCLGTIHLPGPCLQKLEKLEGITQWERRQGEKGRGGLHIGEPVESP